MQNTQVGQTGRIQRWALVFGLLFSLGAPSVQAAGDDRLLPNIEPLQVTQKRAYYSSAPSGQDAPLAAPESPIVYEVRSLEAEEESRLEFEARRLQDNPSLEEGSTQQALRSELKQFGYDIFRSVPSTFAPVEGIPVPADYRIGPGDHVVVQLFGKRNVEYNLVVTRDGKILVPEFGPVAVGGLSFEEAELLIIDGFERRAIGARAVVTMGQLRTIQIRVAGDVRQPGVFTVGGLSTLTDALLATGGVANTGTLRDIRLIRAGRTIARIDLYDLLLRGNSPKDPFLKHNDTLFVPPIGDVIYVGGEVQRPAIYEARGQMRLANVIDMAGGLLPGASLFDSHIERIDNLGRRTVIDFKPFERSGGRERILGSSLKNGDFIRILPLDDQLEGVVLVEGPVRRPGAYQHRADLRVSGLVSSTSDLLRGTDTEFALIERVDPATLRTQVVYTNPELALRYPGTEFDTLLQSRDRLQLFLRRGDREGEVADLTQRLDQEANDATSSPTFKLFGAVKHRGRFPLAGDARVLDAIRVGGGLATGADVHYGLIARTTFPGARVSFIQFGTAEAEFSEAANPVLQPGDRVYVFEASAQAGDAYLADIDRLRAQASARSPAPVVATLGKVMRPGDYPVVPGMRASDLLCAGGGLALNADALNVTLSRNRATDPYQPLNGGFLAQVCRASQNMAAGFLTPDEAAAFNAQYADPQRNPIVEPGDQLAVTEDPDWRPQFRVELAGEVQLPGVYVVTEGETLCNVLDRAGGLTRRAYGFGAELTRESIRQLQQNTLDALQDRLDDLMVDLSLSHSFNNEEKASHEWAGKQDALRVIRQLERAKVSGRLVIDMDKVLDCEAGDAVPLESGDRLFVPTEPDYVQVAGQVYVPTSHRYDADRGIEDYIEMSGGETVLGKANHAYVIQANGEVLMLDSERGKRLLVRASSQGKSSVSRSRSRHEVTHIMPGARIYVPLNVDRMNATEKAQSWVSVLAQSAILAGIVL